MKEDIFLYPIDIGHWESYKPYSDEEQIAFQKENLNPLPIDNGIGQISFIYTKSIDRYNELLESCSSQIKLEDTTVAFENEIFYTAKIEGANTTRKRTTELHNGSPVDKNNEYSEYMVKNGFAATKFLNVYGNKINEEILYDVWKILTEKCRDNEDIQGKIYRNGEVDIGGFSGCNVESIKSSMDKWISFYNSELLNSKPFIKATILHYSFETIHPFCDGNGRVGRLLMNNYLISQGIDSAKAVSFSMEIDKTRAQYDSAFIDAENAANDCTPFIEYMLSKMIDAYESALMIQKEKTPIAQSEKMEMLREDFFTKPKEERTFIEWQGRQYRITAFEDLYLSQCKKEGRNPDEQIIKHFNNVVAAGDYIPQFVNNDFGTK